jgi:uncharacterized membrane protein
MVSKLLILLGLATADYSSVVAVSAAYTLNTQAAPVPEKCCGLCKGGKIVHGDGHVTDCPCPPGCKCKAKSVLLPECRDCKPLK